MLWGRVQRGQGFPQGWSTKPGSKGEQGLAMSHEGPDPPLTTEGMWVQFHGCTEVWEAVSEWKGRD